MSFAPLDLTKVVASLSGVAGGMSLYGIIPREKRPPVSASNIGIQFNINNIEKDVFYEVEYEGTKQAIRLTDDGYLERYEVE